MTYQGQISFVGITPNVGGLYLGQVSLAEPAITLKTKMGLNQVDNTSDANKPIPSSVATTLANTLKYKANFEGGLSSGSEQSSFSPMTVVDATTFSGLTSGRTYLVDMVIALFSDSGMQITLRALNDGSIFATKIIACNAVHMFIPWKVTFVASSTSHSFTATAQLTQGSGNVKRDYNDKYQVMLFELNPAAPT